MLLFTGLLEILKVFLDQDSISDVSDIQLWNGFNLIFVCRSSYPRGSWNLYDWIRFCWNWVPIQCSWSSRRDSCKSQHWFSRVAVFEGKTNNIFIRLSEPVDIVTHPCMLWTKLCTTIVLILAWDKMVEATSFGSRNSSRSYTGGGKRTPWSERLDT